MRTSNIVQKSLSDREVGANAIAMSIDEASSVFLMDALGKLYSRPAQAVLREYLSNAVDAHKAKGGKLPAIQITLPEESRHSGKATLRIRDFGKGMNEEEFGSILSRYGASTKRDSNAMIGGFGLGAKSGFALSDEFFMTSYQNGMGLRVRIFKDNLNQGYIDVIDRFMTKEADGILVEVPIPKGNVAELSKKALYTEFPFFMGYGIDAIDVRPVADYAGQSVHNSKAYSALELAGKTIGWVGNNTGGAAKMYGLIGKVAYNIDLTHLKALAFENKVDKDFAANIAFLAQFRRTKVIDIPIGSVDMPSAREEITYSERSIKTLSAILSNYVLMLKQHYQKELNAKKTKLQVLKFVAELEGDAYNGKADLSWKGIVFDDHLLKQSNLSMTVFARGGYGKDAVTHETSANIRGFRGLRHLSDKTEHPLGVFRIDVDSKSDFTAVRKLLNEKLIRKFLSLNVNSYRLTARAATKAVFIAVPKDDVLGEWLFNTTPLEISALTDIIEQEKREEQLEQERKEAEKAKREAAREKSRKARESRAQSMLANFVVNDSNARSIARNTVENVFKDSDEKRYYWSQEEVNQFANVTKVKKLTGSGGEETHLLFPFVATEVPNTFIPVKEGRSYDEINYLVKLRAFLRVFFESGTKMIILDKTWDLEEFKAAYPAVESGVLAVKEAVESQLADEHSAIMIAYNAIGDAKWKDKSEAKNLLRFVKALDEAQVAELSTDITSAVERFKVVMESSTINGLDDKYFMEALKGFATLAAIKEKSYSVATDSEILTEKYPLLMKGDFSTRYSSDKYSQAIVSHLLDYIKMCDSSK